MRAVRAQQALVLSVACVTLVSGCKAISGFKNELDVKFSANATAADRQAIRTVCGALPEVVLEPPPPAGSADARTGDVFFDITKTGQHELAALYACLANKPGVQGAVESDDDN